MKKVLMASIILICMLSACSVWPQEASPSPTHVEMCAEDIKSFIFWNGSIDYSTYYKISLDDLTARIKKSDYIEGEIDVEVQWNREKWDSFAADIIDCGVQNWNGDYDEHLTDGDVWEVTISGRFGTVGVRGNGAYPYSYDKLREVLERYFKAEEPTSGAPAIEFVDEVYLPTPEEGDWYEWDKAGNYPANIDWDGSLYYIENEDLLVRTETEDGDTWRIVVSRLDGSEAATLDTDADSTINYYKGYIYYSKDGTVLKIKPDGSQKQRVIENVHLYFIYDERIYTDFLESYDMEGGNRKVYDIPDVFIGPYFFENGYFYYGAVEEDEEGGDCWSIYRYNLETGKFKELMRNAMGSFAVKSDMVYYIEDSLMRTDGKTTAPIENCYVYNFNMYRNYILPINDCDSICVFDIETGKEYSLFNLPEFCDNVFVMENSVFLYSGCVGDPVYRITFEDDKAKLWRLNGLNS